MVLINQSLKDFVHPEKKILILFKGDGTTDRMVFKKGRGKGVKLFCLDQNLEVTGRPV